MWEGKINIVRLVISFGVIEETAEERNVSREGMILTRAEALLTKGGMQSSDHGA